MATAKKRSSSSATVPTTALAHATSALQKLPEKPKEVWSLKEVISMMQESIDTALSKGYSYEDIASTLRERGIQIRPSSLRYYLAAAKKRKAAEAPKKIRRTGKVEADKSASSEQLTLEPEVAPKSRRAKASKDAEGNVEPKRRARATSETRSKNAAKTKPAEAKTKSVAAEPDADAKPAARTTKPRASAKPRTASKTPSSATTSRRRKKEETT